MKKNNEPRYSLGIDTETSGFSLPLYASRHQVLSIALVIVENRTLEIIDSLYIELQYDSKYEWSAQAEAIHGLSREYLRINGVTPDDAAAQVANFIFKYFGSGAVMFIGHNPQFDLAFLGQLLNPHGLMPLVYHRIIDSSVLGFICLGTHLSDEIFELLGFAARKEHNCMEDIIYTIESLKIIREKFNTLL